MEVLETDDAELERADTRIPPKCQRRRPAGVSGRTTHWFGYRFGVGDNDEDVEGDEKSKLSD